MQQVVPCVLHSTTDQIKQVMSVTAVLIYKRVLFIHLFKLINRLLLMNIQLVKMFGGFLAALSSNRNVI